MSIEFQVLGDAGRDNALFVRIDNGQAVSRLLFDCGEGCLSALPFAEVQAVDHLFFSHLHIDHVAGFDGFFRCAYGRDAKQNHIWGPPETTEILHHRFRGFLWNLVAGQLGTRRFELGEAFAVAHEEADRPYDGLIVDEPGYTVVVALMDHATPSAAYLVREKPRVNIDAGILASLGLRPGPWLKQLREPPADLAKTVVIDGQSHLLAELRERLVKTTPGDSIAYLTDFRMDEAALARLAVFLRDCKTVVCECQYRHADFELAERNYHMTARLAAEAARRARVGRLVLFHLSDRYGCEEWLEMLAEAREVFPDTEYPERWRVDE